MKPIKHQQGTTLVISLILLVVLTILSATNMERGQLEMKLVAGFKDRAEAQAVAEIALGHIESTLQNNPPHAAQMHSSCSGSDCYNKHCDNGLCFSGSFETASSIQRCQVGESKKDLKSSEMWTDDSKHRILDLKAMDQQVKYIIEFMCFTSIMDAIPESTNEGLESNTSSINRSAFTELYRISALAQGSGERADVMLQSYYRVARD